MLKVLARIEGLLYVEVLSPWVAQQLYFVDWKSRLVHLLIVVLVVCTKMICGTDRSLEKEHSGWMTDWNLLLCALVACFGRMVFLSWWWLKKFVGWEIAHLVLWLAYCLRPGVAIQLFNANSSHEMAMWYQQYPRQLQHFFVLGWLPSAHLLYWAFLYSERVSDTFFVVCCVSQYCYFLAYDVLVSSSCDHLTLLHTVCIIRHSCGWVCGSRSSHYTLLFHTSELNSQCIAAWSWRGSATKPAEITLLA